MDKYRGDITMADIPTNIDKTAENIKTLYQNGSRIVNKIADVVSGQIFTKNPRIAVPFGAQPPITTPANISFNGTQDFRPRLQIPESYLTSGKTSGAFGIIRDSKGIIFPYTPTISQDYKAIYTSATPMHSNYAVYAYKNSQPGEISVSAKFTVQNDDDAHYFLATIHILRSLTKMKFGSDPDAGAPPPVCRLFAYGDYVLNNVPVAVQSFQLKLDDGCDYFSTSDSNLLFQYHGQNTIPTISTITLSLIPMYSRNEMLQFNVDQWINGSLREQGYL